MNQGKQFYNKYNSYYRKTSTVQQEPGIIVMKRFSFTKDGETKKPRIVCPALC